MRLANLRVPTVAASMGWPLVPVSLALACDMVVASQAASFMLPFAKIGLIPDTACSWLVPPAPGSRPVLWAYYDRQ